MTEKLHRMGYPPLLSLEQVVKYHQKSSTANQSLSASSTGGQGDSYTDTDSIELVLIKRMLNQIEIGRYCWLRFLPVVELYGGRDVLESRWWEQETMLDAIGSAVGHSK